MSQEEDQILKHAGIILDAVALSRAVLDEDFLEARFRAGLVACHAGMAGLVTVERAAEHVVNVLTPSEGLYAVGIGPAIERLSIAIDCAQEID